MKSVALLVTMTAAALLSPASAAQTGGGVQLTPCTQACCCDEINTLIQPWRQ